MSKLTAKLKDKLLQLVAVIYSLIEGLFQLIVSIPHDKLLHLIVCTYLYEVFHTRYLWWISLLLVAFVSAAKELIWDKFLDKGTPELSDFIYSMAGPLIMLFIRLHS